MLTVMSRRMATIATLHLTTTKNVDASVVSQPQASSQHPPSPSSQSLSAQQFNRATIPQDTHETYPTHDWQSEFRNGNGAGENKNNQTDDNQSGATNGHDAGANKQISELTVIETKFNRFSKFQRLLSFG